MMDHGESIYNLLPAPLPEIVKLPMHKSKFPGNLPPTASTFHTKGTTNPKTSNVGGNLGEKPVADQGCRTLGRLPGSYQAKPMEYMRKNAKNEKVKTLKEVKQHDPEVLKPSQVRGHSLPAVPRARDAPPVMNLVTSKNFLVSNAVEVILAAPNKLPKATKDYLNKEDYGKVPRYLPQIKKDIEAEYDYVRQLQEQGEEMSRPRVRPMEEEERQHLLASLKAKWEEVNTAYQGMTHMSRHETAGRKARKERLEVELSQMEKDIQMLSRKTILVNCS